MDFAALMSKEMGKSKQPSDSDSNSKKYMKRTDVEAERKAAYLAEQKALEEEREAKAAAKRKREEEAAAEKEAREDKRRKLAEESRRRREKEEWEEEQARRRRLGLPEKIRATSEDANGDGDAGKGAEDVPEEELVVKLREIGQPVVLFGEGHVARVRRYRKLTTVMTDGPIPTTLELVEEKDMKVEGYMPKDKEGRKWLYRQLASYFTMVLTAYQKAMEAEKQDTAARRNAYNTMIQTRENLKPVSMFRTLVVGMTDTTISALSEV